MSPSPAFNLARGCPGNTHAEQLSHRARVAREAEERRVAGLEVALRDVLSLAREMRDYVPGYIFDEWIAGVEKAADGAGQ